MSVGSELVKNVLRTLRRPRVERRGRKPGYTEAEYLYVRAVLRKRRELRRQLAALPSQAALAKKLRVESNTITRIGRVMVDTYAHLDRGERLL